MPSVLFPLALLPDIGGMELFFIFIVVLLLFGGQRMPELARGLGKSIREFKKATSGVEEQIKQALNDAPDSSPVVPKRPPAPPPPPAQPPAPPATGAPPT